MKPVKGYEEAKAMGEGQERLPIGGYIVKILDVKMLEYTWGDVIAASFDIIEGDYAGYYAENYKMQTQEDKKWKGVRRMNVPKGDGTEKDGWTLAAFKRDIEAVEDSNKGFHWDWDESKLKNKVVGAIFHDQEYDYNGQQGFWTACHHFAPVDVVREGKFKIPKPKMLNKDASAMNDFTLVDLPEGELPF